MKGLDGLSWTAMSLLICLLLLAGRLCSACNVYNTCLSGRCWNVMYACYLTRDEARTRCATDYEALATHLTSTEIAHLGFVVASQLSLGDNTLWIDGDVTSAANKLARWYDGSTFTFDHIFYNGSCLRLIAFQKGSYLDTNECYRGQQFICHASPPLPTTTPAATTTKATTAEATTLEATTVEATTEPETTTLMTTQAETTTTATTTLTTEETTSTSTTENSSTEDSSTISTSKDPTTTEDTITTTTTSTTTTSTSTEENTTGVVTTEADTTAAATVTSALTATDQMSVTTGVPSTEKSSAPDSMVTGEALDNSTSQYVVTPTTKALCYCSTCPTTSADVINMTELPLSEFVLTKKRKGETRLDNRPSAVAIGSVGVGVLVAVAAIIIVPDLPRVFSDVRHAIRHCCCHGNETDVENAQKRRKK